MPVKNLVAFSMISAVAMSSLVRAAGTETSAATLLGISAGASLDPSAAENTFIGAAAGTATTTGSSNVFIGKDAGWQNTTGERNTFVGEDAGGSNTTGSSNTLIGENAGLAQTTAGNNTFLGKDSGRFTTTGSLNTYLGRYSGRSNTTGYENTFVGSSAGYDNQLGLQNTYIGHDAGNNNVNGITNTMLGHSAGRNNISGNGNVFLGYAAGLDETGSYKLYIESSASTDPLIYGDFINDIVGVNGVLGVGTELPNATLHVRRGDGSAKVMVEETNTFVAARTLFEISNAGNTKFAITNSDAGETWAFTNSGVDFRISRQGSGSVEMKLSNSGNLELIGTSTASNHINSSSRKLKQGFKPVNSTEVLKKVKELPISSWEYIKPETGGRHIGPVAEDFQNIFGLGDGKHISTIDSVGIALAAIQGLTQELENKDAQIQELRKTYEASLDRLQNELLNTQVMLKKILAKPAIETIH